jgi:hypothetical protein
MAKILLERLEYRIGGAPSTCVSEIATPRGARSGAGH